jgi:PleD family two-component response regulator
VTKLETLNQEIADKIIGLIKSKEIGASASEIAREIAHNRVTVSKYLEVMKAQGILTNKIVAQAKLWAVSENHCKPTVLIVEDERNILDLIRLSLIPGQYNVLEAMDGVSALQQIKDLHPDLVLLDLMLPKIDGKEICRIVKSDPGTQGIPVIMLTAKSQTIDKVEGLKIGADDYMTKPFDPLELEARVESMLKRTSSHMTKHTITGMPGISVLMDKLVDFSGSILFVDIKSFKDFNSAFGYRKGNELLQIISRIIKNTIAKRGGKNDAVCHIDSDNFIVLTRGDPEQISAEIVGAADMYLPEYKKGYKVKLTIKHIIADKVKNEVLRGDIEKIHKRAAAIR